MVDSRKLLLALIAGALLLGTVSASAADYSCQAIPVPTDLRVESYTDYGGDVLLQCSGTVPDATKGIVANIRLYVSNTNITSNPLVSTTPFPVISEATLVLNGAGAPGHPAPVGYSSSSATAPTPYTDGSQNVYQGFQIDANTIEWYGVVLAGPDTTPAETIRLTNVRLNAVGKAIGTDIRANVYIDAPTSVPIQDSSQLVVSTVRKGLTGSVSNQVTFKNCEPKEAASAFSVTLVEGFGTAFRPLLNTNYPNVPHSSPAGGYFDEQGYNPTNFAASGLAGGSLYAMQSIGAANAATQFQIRVANIPSGVTVTAPAAANSSNGLYLARTSAATNGSSSSMTFIYKVDYYSGTQAQTLADTVTIPFTVSYTVPGTLGTATVEANFYPDSTVNVLSATAPEPRFVYDPQVANATAFQINPCRTILLFPYVVNTGVAWDTGIVIANTTMDPIGTQGQHGACTLYFYGTAAGAALTTAQKTQTTPDVPAGGMFLMVVSSGGAVQDTAGSAAVACTAGAACKVPGFQGYMIASCDFQFAHGFAFIAGTTGGASSEGYLALVIPDRRSGSSSVRLPDPLSTVGVVSINAPGEQLGN